MGKIVHTFDCGTTVVGTDTYTGVETTRSAVFGNANLGDFVKQESPGPRKSFFNGALQLLSSSNFMYPILLTSSTPAKYMNGWYVESASVTDDQWTLVVSEGHSIQTGDTIWFDFGATSIISNQLVGGMQINAGSTFREEDNGGHDNVTVNGNTITFTGNYDYGGTFAASYNVSKAQIDSIQNPCFYAKVTYENTGVKYLTPMKRGDVVSIWASSFAKHPDDTASGAKNGWTYVAGGDSPSGDKLYYVWLVLQPTHGSREGASIPGSSTDFAFANNVIETVEFGGALVGNDDYGDFSKDESPIGRSMISHDFITNKIIGN